MLITLSSCWWHYQLSSPIQIGHSQLIGFWAEVIRALKLSHSRLKPAVTEKKNSSCSRTTTHDNVCLYSQTDQRFSTALSSIRELRCKYISNRIVANFKATNHASIFPKIKNHLFSTSQRSRKISNSKAFLVQKHWLQR